MEPDFGEKHVLRDKKCRFHPKRFPTTPYLKEYSKSVLTSMKDHFALLRLNRVFQSPQAIAGSCIFQLATHNETKTVAQCLGTSFLIRYRKYFFFRL